jgi:PAS domain S-box-containing protein
MQEFLSATTTILKSAAAWVGLVLAGAMPMLAVAAKEARANGRKRNQSAGPMPASRSLQVDSEQRFRALFDQASVGVALETMEGQILHANPALSQLLGYSEEELRAMRCTEFSHPEDEVIETPLFAELREGRRSSYQVDKRFRSKSGEWIWGRVSVSLLRTESDTPLVVGFIEDIQERKKAEEQLRAAKLELEQLAGRLLSAQEEERRRISRELHDDIGQRMSLVTNEMERIEQELHRRNKSGLAVRAAMLKCHLSELASAIHGMCANLHSSKLEHLGLRSALGDLSAKFFAHSGVSVFVDVDEHADRMHEEVALCFYRVVQEALNNVSKHSESTTAEVTARREGDVIRLTVRDFGVGFDASALRSCSGIGLASMRERLRTINGSLVVRSNMQLGTEVIAEAKYVPRARATN